MKRNLLLVGLFASLAFSSTTWAQPAIPAVPVAPVAVPAAPGNLWSFLLPNKEQCSHIKTVFCESGIGQMVNGLAGPFSLMSGGLIKNRCLKNSILNDLKKPADTPEGAAARVAADAEAAKARRDSVRALGLVDCNYWPEAIDVLTVSLRGDRSECVRFEAALALRNGCCCNKATVKALEMSVSGSNADGFPAERSERVRAAAADALARCPIIETPAEEIGKPKLTRNTLPPNVDPKEYYKKVALMSNEQVAASARTTLAGVQQASKTQAESNAATPSSGSVGTVATVGHQRAGSLAGIVSNAFSGNADPQTRMPFFTSLTRSLTGKQNNTMQHYMMPAPGNTAAAPPDIHTFNPIDITPPTPPVVNVVAPTRMKSDLQAVEIAPTVEFKNPPREKKSSVPHDLPLPRQSINSFGKPQEAGFIQLSPHVRQIPAMPSKPAITVEAVPPTPEIRSVPTSSNLPEIKVESFPAKREVVPIQKPAVKPSEPVKLFPAVPVNVQPVTFIDIPREPKSSPVFPSNEIPARSVPKTIPTSAVSQPAHSLPISPRNEIPARSVPTLGQNTPVNEMPIYTQPISPRNEIPARSVPTMNHSSTSTPNVQPISPRNEIPARSAPASYPAVRENAAPTILQTTHVVTPNSPPANVTIINVPPGSTALTTSGSSPILPPNIVQTSVPQTQESNGPVTLEFNPR